MRYMAPVTTQAVQFLNAEIRAGTSGIVTTLSSQQLLPSLRAANAVGIPVYVVGGGDPKLLGGLRRNEVASGPVRASLRSIGTNIERANTLLADKLLASGVTHVECLVTDVTSLLEFHRCDVLVRAFEAVNGTGNWHVRADLDIDLAIYVTAMESALVYLPGSQIAVVVMDSSVYSNIKDRLRQGSKADATLAVYETSVQAMQDIRDGHPVLVYDPRYYTQGFLAVALLAAELQTGQMLASDIVITPTIYGGNHLLFAEVTNDMMQREVCRAAGNPVCGDPGVVPVTSSGCRCFDRHAVKYKVISGLPKTLTDTYLLWQGMKDAERDLPGSTFDWHVADGQVSPQIYDYHDILNCTAAYAGAIWLDAAQPNVTASARAALRSLSEAGKPLYLGYRHADPAGTQAALDAVGARSFVGAAPFGCGRNLSLFAKRAGFRHMLAFSTTPNMPWSWEMLHGVAVMGGSSPLAGSDILATLFSQIKSGVPATDMVAAEANEFVTPQVLAYLGALQRRRDPRPPVRMVTQGCTLEDLRALLRGGVVEGEQLFLGCMDEQPYLSAYLVATLAALEQHTKRRIVRDVDTARLLRASPRPIRQLRRVSCEMEGYNRGVTEGRMGAYYPVCDARRGCVPGGMDAPRGTEACSGHGSCHFPANRDPSGTTDPLQGTCRCIPGWKGKYCEVVVAAKRASETQEQPRRAWLAALLVPGSLLLLGAAAGLLWLWRARRGAGDAAKLKEFLRKRMPPRRGDGIAAVVTDIEGSTSLWEWNPEVMNQALAIHHHVLRTLLPKYYGYESDTEGDSFTLVFHDAIDALGWAMEVQRQLLFPAGVFGTKGTPPCHVGARHPRHKEEGRLREGDQLTDWPPELLGTEACKEVKDPMDGSVLYRGLRVRMGIHIGIPDACIMHPNGRQHYQGEVVELAKAIQGAAASGGQVLVSMEAWNSLGVHMRSVVCHHMGMHALAERLPPVHLMQVIPPELVKRAPFLPLKSRQLRPSFFDAPCATECYLKAEPPKQPVVICFMYVGGASTLRRTPGYQQSITLLVGFVQSRLSQYEAYECEEKEGNFLLAFWSPIQAANFAEAVQREAMDLDWPEKLLEQDAAAEVVKLEGNQLDGGHERERVVFRGLRMQIGLCMGVPDSCQPDVATGRSPYCGPVVNRAARIAATAAPGQTLANQEVFEGAKGQTQRVSFQELGSFGLKGVKEPLHLCQISSQALSPRLFPRTLKLARPLVPATAADALRTQQGQEGDATGPTWHAPSPAAQHMRGHHASTGNTPPTQLMSQSTSEASERRVASWSVGRRPRGVFSTSTRSDEVLDMSVCGLSYDDLVACMRSLLAELEVLERLPSGRGVA
eukprot:jgi/Mesvir1/14000/Mv02852-RA.1